MPYTLNFSDPTKQATITVPDMPPGLNTVDTSLNLVGRGYPNYGQKHAENFLHLLENFASPNPPENPIEGQLWYDTSDPGHKVLRVMDGTATAVRWPSANGIYQQSTDPNSNYTVKNGDIWVDTSENNLKIWNGLTWQLVGPNSNTSNALLTGSVVENVKAIDGSTYPVIKNYVNGDVISIVSGLTTATFTPASVIQGFLQIKPGITMSNQTVNGITSQLFGTAQNAYNLRVDNNNYPSTEFLRKSDTTPTGQEITGKVVFRTTSTTGSLGRDGIVILPQGKTTEYVQLYQSGNDAVLLNNTIGGKLKLQTNPTGVSNDLLTGIEIDPVSGVTVAVPATMAAVRATVTTATQLTVSGNTAISGTLAVTGKSTLGNVVANVTTVTQLIVGTNVTIGGKIVVSEIRSGSTSTTATFYGNVVGTASKLDKPVLLAIQGQVTATIVSVQGDGVGSTINTSLTTRAISAQTPLTTANTATSMMVLDGNSLYKITKRNFLLDIVRPGTIMLWPSATQTPPPGYLMCDGSAKSINSYPDLFAEISWTFGNSGAVFNLPYAPGPATNVYYIIKY